MQQGWRRAIFIDAKVRITLCVWEIVKIDDSYNKSQYWPRGAPKHAETAKNEKA